MGTRSITHIHEMKELDADESIVCSFFRHWDAYPTGHGQDLADWLCSKSLVNGISGDFNKKTMFNRAGSMAVKLMNHIQDLSGCEVLPTGSKDHWEDYTYHIYFDKHGLMIETNDGTIGIKRLVEDYNGEEVEKAFTEYHERQLVKGAVS